MIASAPGAEGEPGCLYVPDKLHFHPPPYVAFAEIVKPILTKAWNPK